MKKILILIPVFLLAFQISKAQTEKGSQTLGIDLQFMYQKSTQNAFQSVPNPYESEVKNTNFSIGPNYSYFIADKLDIGVSLNYAHTSQNGKNSNYPNNVTSHQYGAALFLRKYFMFGDKLGLRAGPYIGYSRYDFRSADTSTPTKTDSYVAGATMGLVYYPTKKLGVAATLANFSYNHSKIKDDYNSQIGSTNNVNFNIINNGVLLSVFYIFGGK
ncbi:outer membrane beta-barrel protein [Mucilaginibacter sp. P25]|uniref:Outer membrane protein beta-barrel domain-containing protein n=1 Tax=Mucilaginibacter gossypii TaxID=551996 RepID=A0A1G7RUF1_9SPHI|nr:outer membrane beta-barrel protein [Mucilaginibacter gossypii]SDG14413.1 Outer membrane protein beta-barrel domain-containing protein [Mucilaginibacter gossypii]